MPLFFASTSTFLCAQAVTIEVVNGRNGRPVADSHVNVWVGNEQKKSMAIPTDKGGIARLRLTNKDDEVDPRIQWQNEGSYVVVDPILKYVDSLRINVPYALCQPGGSNYSWLAFRQISTKQLMDQAIVTPNTCGKATASPNPGVIVIFVRPLSFWEAMKQ
jgi:hypothetical protein